MKTMPKLFLVALVALAGPMAQARAGDVAMAEGRIGFHVPDDWTDIMDAQGATEMRVFQVPGGPAGTLARVGVMVRQASDYAAFQQFEAGAAAKAKSLPGYQPGEPGPDHAFSYTAREGDTTYAYVERYFYRGNLAVELRCTRPVRAGKAWTAAFEQACGAVAAQLQH